MDTTSNEHIEDLPENHVLRVTFEQALKLVENQAYLLKRQEEVLAVAMRKNNDLIGTLNKALEDNRRLEERLKHRIANTFRDALDYFLSARKS